MAGEHGQGKEWIPKGNTLVDTGSSRCLDLPGGTTINSTQVEIWGRNGSANQQWTLPRTYTRQTTSGIAGKCLEDKAASASGSAKFRTSRLRDTADTAGIARRSDPTTCRQGTGLRCEWRRVFRVVRLRTAGPTTASLPGWYSRQAGRWIRRQAQSRQ